MRRNRFLASVISAAMVLCSLTLPTAVNETYASDEVQELELDVSYNVTLTETDTEQWFSFTPEETGTYAFYSYDCENDPYAYLYDESGYNSCLNGDYGYNLYYSDDDSEDLNFLITYDLSAGETYYYRASAYAASYGVEYSVKLVETKTVTGISVSELPQTEFCLTDYVSFAGMEVTVTYDDGENASFEMGWSSTYDPNTMRYIYFAIYDEQGNWVTSYNSHIGVGNYTVQFYEGDTWSDSYEFTVTVPDAVTALTLDEEVTIEYSDDMLYYSYTPEEDGKYVIEVYDNSLFYVIESGYSTEGYIYNTYCWEDDITYHSLDLEAGMTYYFEMETHTYNEKGSCKMKLYAANPIEAISVADEGEFETEFDFGDNVSFGETVLNIEYADGTTSDFTLEYSYQMDPVSGEYLHYDISGESGNVVSYGYSRLVAGTYTVVFYAEDCESDAYTFTVKDSDDVTALELNGSYNENSTGYEYIWYSFTPEETGTYAFCLSDFDTEMSVEVYTSNDGEVNGWFLSYEDGDTYAECDLISGTTYYYSIYCYGDTDYDLTFYQTQKVTGIYAPNIYSEYTMDYTLYFDYTDIVIKYSGENNEYELWTWPVDCGVNYGIYNAESGKLVSSEYGALPEGTYYVIFTYGEFESPMYEFTVASTENVTELEIDDEELMDYSNCGEHKWFTFTPEESASYTFSLYDITSAEIEVAIYSDEAFVDKITFEADDYDAEEGVSVSVALEAGVTYYYRVTGYADGNSYSVMLSMDYTLGDVNEDGAITYLDAMAVLRYDAELITLTDAQMSAGDVNGDGKVNSLDAILILRYDAQLITEF